MDSFYVKMDGKRMTKVSVCKFLLNNWIRVLGSIPRATFGELVLDERVHIGY